LHVFELFRYAMLKINLKNNNNIYYFNIWKQKLFENFNHTPISPKLRSLLPQVLPISDAYWAVWPQHRFAKQVHKGINPVLTNKKQGQLEILFQGEKCLMVYSKGKKCQKTQLASLSQHIAITIYIIAWPTREGKNRGLQVN
jgi:hypothetical protein